MVRRGQRSGVQLNRPVRNEFDAAHTNSVCRIGEFTQLIVHPVAEIEARTQPQVTIGVELPVRLVHLGRDVHVVETRHAHRRHDFLRPQHRDLGRVRVHIRNKSVNQRHRRNLAQFTGGYTVAVPNDDTTFRIDRGGIDSGLLQCDRVDIDP